MASYLSVSGIFSQPETTGFYPAMAMGPDQRQELGLHALAGTAPISRLAAEHEVSRKFIYRQRTRAMDPGADVDSTYCYLLSLEDHRDGDTWGLRLLELHDRGFQPEATIADAGSGLRAGQSP